MLALLTGLPVIGPIIGAAISPTGRVVVLALAVVLYMGYREHKAATNATAQCRAEEIQKDLTEMTRQRDAAWEALADAEKRQAASDAALAKLQKEGDAINEESKPLAVEPCRIPPASTKRMRNIK